VGCLDPALKKDLSDRLDLAAIFTVRNLTAPTGSVLAGVLILCVLIHSTGYLNVIFVWDR
jgi:hypothetical protein